jgi:hypothetical protein
MKNVGTGVLALLAFGICCGGPLIIGSLSLATLGLFAGDVLVLTLAAALGAAGFLVLRQKQRQACDCSEKELQEKEIHFS